MVRQHRPARANDPRRSVRTKEFGEKDEGKAWEWFEAEERRRRRGWSTRNLTVSAVAQLYMAWAKARVGRRPVVKGKISPEHYKNKQLHLKHLNAHLGARVASSLGPGT